MYSPSVAENKMINLASGAFQTTNKSKCLQEILQGLVCQNPEHPCILMPRENDEAAKKLDMTSHISHHLCVLSRITLHTKAEDGRWRSCASLHGSHPTLSRWWRIRKGQSGSVQNEL